MDVIDRHRLLAIRIKSKCGGYLTREEMGDTVSLCSRSSQRSMLLWVRKSSRRPIVQSILCMISDA